MHMYNMKSIYCVVGITFLLSSLASSIVSRDRNVFINFMNLLDENQKLVYENIIRERLLIYLSGMMLGLACGVIYYMNNKKDKYILCKFLTIIYLVKFGFYYIYPKSPLMLYSLKNTKQTDAWADIYTEMKSGFKYSLILGFIGYLLIGRYLC